MNLQSVAHFLESIHGISLPAGRDKNTFDSKRNTKYTILYGISTFTWIPRTKTQYSAHTICNYAVRARFDYTGRYCVPVVASRTLQSIQLSRWCVPFICAIGAPDEIPEVGLVCTAFVGKALEYGLTKGRFKVGERYPGESRTVPSVVLARAIATGQGANFESNEPNWNGHSYQTGPEGANGHGSPIGNNRSPLLRNLNDLADLFFSIRGIGWDFGTDHPLHVPREWRQTELVGVFLRQTATQLFLSLLVFDSLECIFKLIPGVGTPEGGTIFLPQLPPLQRYLLSSLLTLMTGLVVVFTFQMWYNYFTLMGVGLLGHSPLSYPPLFNAPWKAQSVASFWGARWHQLVRQSFFIYGGYPLQWLCATAVSFCSGKNSKAAKKAGDVGLVMGTFMGSGFFHGIGIWTMHAGSDQKGGFDYQAPIYFTVCAFVVLAERLFKMTTGKKVGGLWGWLWMAFWIVGASQLMGESSLVICVVFAD
jgi:hypothetical protein